MEEKKKIISAILAKDPVPDKAKLPFLLLLKKGNAVAFGGEYTKISIPELGVEYLNEVPKELFPEGRRVIKGVHEVYREGGIWHYYTFPYIKAHFEEGVLEFAIVRIAGYDHKRGEVPEAHNFEFTDRKFLFDGDFNLYTSDGGVFQPVYSKKYYNTSAKKWLSMLVKCIDSKATCRSGWQEYGQYTGAVCSDFFDFFALHAGKEYEEETKKGHYHFFGNIPHLYEKYIDRAKTDERLKFEKSAHKAAAKSSTAEPASAVRYIGFNRPAKTWTAPTLRPIADVQKDGYLSVSIETKHSTHIDYPCAVTVFEKTPEGVAARMFESFIGTHDASGNEIINADGKIDFFAKVPGVSRAARTDILVERVLTPIATYYFSKENGLHVNIETSCKFDESLSAFKRVNRMDRFARGVGYIFPKDGKLENLGIFLSYLEGTPLKKLVQEDVLHSRRDSYNKADPAALPMIAAMYLSEVCMTVYERGYDNIFDYITGGSNYRYGKLRIGEYSSPNDKLDKLLNVKSVARNFDKRYGKSNEFWDALNKYLAYGKYGNSVKYSIMEMIDAFSSIGEAVEVNADFLNKLTEFMTVRDTEELEWTNAYTRTTKIIPENYCMISEIIRYFYNTRNRYWDRCYKVTEDKRDRAPKMRIILWKYPVKVVQQIYEVGVECNKLMESINSLDLAFEEEENRVIRGRMHSESQAICGLVGEQIINGALPEDVLAKAKLCKTYLEEIIAGLLVDYDKAKEAIEAEKAEVVESEVVESEEEPAAESQEIEETQEGLAEEIQEELPEEVQEAPEVKLEPIMVSETVYVTDEIIW